MMHSTNTPHHDLTTDSWLPVSLLQADATGQTTATWSLRELLIHAHEARGLSEPSPLTFTALIRYLLAILHRATEGPTDEAAWVAMWDRGCFDEVSVNDYLDRWRHRFNLFDAELPFAQAVIPTQGTDISPITRLLPERSSGNNATLFDHSWDADPLVLDSGAAARALLTAQSYAFAGTGGMFKDSTMVAGYCLFLEGQNLFQTLMLNLQRYDPHGLLDTSASLDQPWWESEQDPTIQTTGNRPLGLTDLLTWRARQIHLLPDDDGSVRHCRYRQWYALRPGSALDPYKRYAPVQSGENVGNLVPQNFQPDRALWRDSYGFFPPEYHNQKLGIDVLRPGIIDWTAQIEFWLGDRDRSLVNPDGTAVKPTLLATGLVNNQAKIFLWRMDRMPLPLEVLENVGLARLAERAVRRAEEARSCLAKAAKTYAETLLTRDDRERKPNPDDVRREISTLRFLDRYWAALDLLYPNFIRALGTTGDSKASEHAFSDWEVWLRQTAAEVFFDATESTNTDSNRWRARAVGIRALNRELKVTFG